MNCYQCGEEIPRGEGIKYNRWMMCEDCYLDNTIVVRTCDPESTRIAKNMEGFGMLTGKANPLETKILEIVEKTGGETPLNLSKQLKVELKEIQRVLAVLRHMRRTKAEKRGEEKYIVLYEREIDDSSYDQTK